MTKVIRDIDAAGVFEDRLEYDAESLASAYPHLTPAQVAELYARLHAMAEQARDEEADMGRKMRAASRRGEF